MPAPFSNSEIFTQSSSTKKKSVVFPLQLPPLPNKLLVKVGQTVKADQALASWQTHSFVPLDVARHLSVPQSQAFSYLKRQIGDLVSQDEIIASRKTLFGQKTFSCPHAGKLIINHHNHLMLAVSHTDHRLLAPFSGSISDISSSQITLQSPAIEFKGLWGIGDQVQGQVFHLTQDILSDLTSGTSSVNLSQRIAVVDFPLDKPIYNRLAALDLRGVFCFQINPELKQKLTQASHDHPQTELVVVEAHPDHSSFSPLISLLSPAHQPRGLLLGDQPRLLIFDQ
jgi:hypothetical protein